jgi:hypothetical protein
MAKFKVGQRVRYIGPALLARHIHMKEGVVRALQPRADLDYVHYEVRFDIGERFACAEQFLRGLYDGDLPSTWQEFERVCGFNPTRVPASAGHTK